ncbi:MAG: hypothetical protein IPM76_18080 [Chloroflexi bacterium]|nr:hypothetical protein [Chloroflexota bacterium]
MNERVVEFPKTKPLGSLWILIFIFNFLLSLPDFTLTIKNRQTDQLGLAVVGPVLKLKRGAESGSATIQTGGLAGSSGGAGDCWVQIQVFHGRHGNKVGLVCQRNE